MAKKNIQSYLKDGEKLVWTGSPTIGKDYTKADRWILPLSALLLAFSAFFAVSLVFSVLRFGFSLHHVVEVLLLLLVGGLSVYAWFIRFSVKRRNKADLVYGITNMRRVIIRDAGTRTFHTFESRDVKHAKMTEVDKYGCGTIYLKRRKLSNAFDNTGMDFLGSEEGLHIALMDIPDCERVYRMITGKKAR